MWYVISRYEVTMTCKYILTIVHALMDTTETVKLLLNQTTNTSSQGYRMSFIVHSILHYTYEKTHLIKEISHPFGNHEYYHEGEAKCNVADTLHEDDGEAESHAHHTP